MERERQQASFHTEMRQEVVLESPIPVLQGTWKLSGDVRCGKLQHRVLYNVLKTKSYTAIYTHIGSKFKV